MIGFWPLAFGLWSWCFILANKDQRPKTKVQRPKRRIAMLISWRGVMPATTTAFDSELKVDHAFVAKHAKWLVDNGCPGVVKPGSLGESATLTFDEKLSIRATVVDQAGDRVPVVAAIASLSTTEAVERAK